MAVATKIKWQIVPLDGNIPTENATSEKQAHKLVRIALDGGISCDLRRNDITTHTYHPGDIADLEGDEKVTHHSWTTG